MEKMIHNLYAVLRVFWRIRTSLCLLLVILGIQLLSKDWATNIAIILFVAVILLKQLLFELRRKISQEEHHSKKRLTSIDRFGNPCIDMADLPEVIQLLYKMEEDDGR